MRIVHVVRTGERSVRPPHYRADPERPMRVRVLIKVEPRMRPGISRERRAGAYSPTHQAESRVSIMTQPLPVAPGYPPQQYGQIPPPAQPAVQLAQGTLDDFYGQPTVGGGQGLKFAVLGTEYYVEQTRPITGADIQQQTDTRGLPQTFRDGRPKFQMLVPVTVLNSNVP